MKAAAFLKTNEMAVLEVERPVPQADQVLIKVAYCGVCATDYDNFVGQTSFAKNGFLRYPLRFGHEWSGVVCEVGADVDNFKVGDRVVGDGKITCGVCENCKKGEWYNCLNLRSVGTVHDHWPGGMAEYILMPARNVFKLGDGVSLKEAALIEPVTIAMNGFRQEDLTGRTVLVIGSGAIGLGGITAARALGAKRVICAARKRFKLDRALEMGATDVIDISKGPLKDQLLEINDGKKAGFVLETSGCTEYVEKCLDYVQKMGTFSMVAFYDRPLTNFNLDNMIFEKITMRGASGSQQFMPVVLDMLNAGKIHLMPLLTQEVDFANVVTVMDEYRACAAERIKMLVRIGGENVGDTL